MHYLDHACLGCPTEPTLRAVSQAVDGLADRGAPGTDRTLSLLRAVPRARERAARLVSARVEDVALVENTTQGLGLLASGIRLRAGDNVVVADLEFLSATLVWRRICEREGVELRRVPSRRGAVPVDAYAAAVDHRTRVVVVSAVQELSGYRVDLDALGTLAREHDAYVVVDGIQEAGALHRDLSRTPVHAYIAGGHKWLGSPFGLGFAWVHPELREHWEPPYLGYFNLADPPGGWERYLYDRARTAFDVFPARRTAAVLESGGTPNWLGAVALSAAVDDLLAAGPPAVEQRVLGLAERLRDGLADLGLAGYVLGADDPRTWSGIVTFGLPGGPRTERRLLTELTRADVQVSLRAMCGVGGIRVSPHAHNGPEDVDALLDVTARVVRCA